MCRLTSLPERRPREGGQAGGVKLREPARRLARILLAVLFLGAVFWLIRGRDLDFSIWGSLAMAAVFVGVGVVVRRPGEAAPLTRTRSPANRL